MIPALPCGKLADADIPAGAFYVAAFEVPLFPGTTE